MDITVKTATPLWTGGIETGRIDRIHETGILGSLRWWMEALVRGMGGEACDPSGQKCPNDAKNPSSSICDVCRVFGTTGWRRRFRLEVINDETQPIWDGHRTLNIRPPDRSRGWFLPPGRMGTFTLRLHGDEASLKFLSCLLLFLERWGSLGAKAQLGYGAFLIDNRSELVDYVRGYTFPHGDQSTHAASSVPNFQHFGFFHYHFPSDTPSWWSRLPGFERVVRDVRPLVEKYQCVPVVPVLKNAWRFQLWQRAWGQAHTFWGTLEPKAIRGKVLISWAYLKNEAWHIHGSVWLEGVQQEPVWAMLQETTRSWDHVLGVKGRLTALPSGAWHPWSQEGIPTLVRSEGLTLPT